MDGRRATARVRIARSMLVVVCGLALAVGIDVVRSGGPGPWLARFSLATPYAPQGRLVDIGGRSVYLDCRGQGSPTVVLESGMGGGAGSWGTVLDAMAATTRTCAYDRPGLGSSTPRGRHTLADTVADLHKALEVAGEVAPFVLVGHSHGGDYVRVFTDRYRSDVAGIVMVDTFDPDLETAYIHPLLGALRPEYEDQLDRLRDLVAQVEDLDWPTSEEQLRAASVAGTPLEVLRAPRADPRLDAATNDKIAVAWVAAYESLSPGFVHYELAWGAGHLIQMERPDLVIAATRRLVGAARTGSR